MNLTLSQSNPAAHISTLIWLKGKMLGYSPAAIQALIKQSMYETAWATDPKVQKYKMTFGMGCAQKREQKRTECVPLNANESLAAYATFWDSVCDRFAWDKYNNIPDTIRKTKSEQEFAAWAIQKGFAGNAATIASLNSERVNSNLREGQMRMALLTFLGFVATISVLAMALPKTRTKLKKMFGPLVLGGPKSRRRRAVTRVRSTASRATARMRTMYRRRKAK